MVLLPSSCCLKSELLPASVPIAEILVDKIPIEGLENLFPLGEGKSIVPIMLRFGELSSAICSGQWEYDDVNLGLGGE